MLSTNKRRYYNANEDELGQILTEFIICVYNEQVSP